MSGNVTFPKHECTRKHNPRVSEEGPPRWVPGGEKCPEDLSQTELDELIAASLPADDDPASCRRFALRRTENGTQFFETKSSNRVESGRPVMHGHPIGSNEVPARIARRWLDLGWIKKSEYNRITKGAL